MVFANDDPSRFRQFLVARSTNHSASACLPAVHAEALLSTFNVALLGLLNWRLT
jgi:hypothetical protein